MLAKLEHWIMEGYWTKHGDPRLMQVPFMGSFRMAVAVLSAYSLFVLVIGPRMMAQRKAFPLKRILLAYNLSMCVINSYFFIQLLINYRETYDRILNTKFPSFTETTKRDEEIIEFNLLYGFTKMIDLMDTIFFVLRKKQSQVTLLHFYHHLSVPFFGWIVFRLCAACNVCVPFMVMNSFLHVLMYGYYGLAALGPAMRPYLWWKRYITMLQLVQFGLLFVHWLYFVTTQQGYSKFFVYNYALQTVLYMVLFTRFYIKTYFKIHVQHAQHVLQGTNQQKPKIT